MKITYDDIQESVETLGLIGLENKDAIKKKYLKLSKKYHPDMPEGSSERFQQINKAYKILCVYADSFIFRFTEKEFIDQNPYLAHLDEKWIYKN